MNTPPKTLLFGLIVAVVLVCLTGALLWPRPCVAEEVAARVRLGMTPEQLRAVNVHTSIYEGTSVPTQFGEDGSWMIVEFSEAPHRVVAVHAYPPDLRRRLRARFPFLTELIPVPYDPVRLEPRPLRPQPPEEAHR